MEDDHRLASSPNEKSPRLINSLGLKFGGGVEIRTLGAVTLDGFQARCLKPLGHSSAMGKTIASVRGLVKAVMVRMLAKSTMAPSPDPFLCNCAKKQPDVTCPRHENA